MIMLSRKCLFRKWFMDVVCLFYKDGIENDFLHITVFRKSDNPTVTKRKKLN